MDTSIFDHFGDRETILRIKDYLIRYLKNPFEAIKNVPTDIGLMNTLVFQGGAAALSGILAGIVSQNLFNMIAGALFFPIAAILVNLIGTGFFYYTFQFFLQRQIPFASISALICFSSLPHLALYTLGGILPPINLIGLASAYILFLVGSVETFLIDRRWMTRVLAALYALSLLSWIYSSIQRSRLEQKLLINSKQPRIESPRKDLKHVDRKA